MKIKEFLEAHGVRDGDGFEYVFTYQDDEEVGMPGWCTFVGCFSEIVTNFSAPNVDNGWGSLARVAPDGKLELCEEKVDVTEQCIVPDQHCENRVYRNICASVPAGIKTGGGYIHTQTAEMVRIEALEERVQHLEKYLTRDVVKDADLLVRVKLLEQQAEWLMKIGTGEKYP